MKSGFILGTKDIVAKETVIKEAICNYGNGHWHLIGLLCFYSHFTFLSGVCSILSIMEGKPWMKLQIWFELVSFFSACTAFDIYLIYTTELFPTCVRNSAISMARQAVVFGGAFGPVLLAAGRGHKILCYGVFGLVIEFSGVFVISLPENKGRALSDTLNEEENKERVVLDGTGHVVA
ncbi:hypothetical protein L6164_018091 [Bauhinia variegata]|uniref:Uncharacterized protein n=1 Tax=Bauhinia variegata TaxID=167791 RepID=A0ACB9NB39_BAUVA|nr:hypothetical protein L6164_018091 [Bauhinia variegata]